MNQKIRAFLSTLALLTMCCLAIATAQIAETKLIASDEDADDHFGHSVSLSGDYMLVGAYGDENDTGSAYIFHHDGSTWVEQTKLIASDGEEDDHFGYQVSLSGDYALVGAHEEDNENGSNAGSAYIFHYDGSGWVEQTKLIASDGTEDDEFGYSVSLSGDYALVGTYGDDDNGTGAGSAYIFHYDGSNWVAQTKLRASDGKEYDRFGYSVSLSGDYALIGAINDRTAAGSAYIFHYDGSNWIEQSKLTASDPGFYDQFGTSVSLSGDYALVGTHGSAYIFHYDGSNWVEQTKLNASDGSAEGSFGWSVSLSGDYAIVGALFDDDNGQFSGSAYIFHYDGLSWVEQTKLIASDGEAFDQFGRSVSLSGDYVLVGAHRDENENGPNAGSAYVYAGLVPPLAHYGIFYGSTDAAEPTNPGALITIDPLTGAGTLVGPTDIIGDTGPSVPALAIKSTGEMYAVSASTNSGLYTVNASTGAGTFVANMGISLPGAMAFDRTDHLYVVDGSENLYAVDETNGSAALIGPLGFNARGIAFDPTDGVLYGSSGADEIYTIDPTTATSTLVGYTGLGGSTPDIHFDQQGNLIGTKLGTNTIYDLVAIDKHTGAGTIIGSIGYTAVIGLSARLRAFPSQVELLSPSAGEVLTENTAVFLWRAGEPLVDRYWFELSEDSLFASPTIDSTITDSTTTILNLETGNYWWRVRAHNVAGWGSFSETWSFSVLITDVDDEASIPDEFSLSQNYPNPFNPSTTFRYGLREPGQVSLKVYNMLGQLVRTIVDEQQIEGYHEVVWDGRNEVGETVSSGIYIYRMTSGSFVETKRMLLIK